MPRLSSILLLICFAASGTGLLGQLHNLQHERQDAGRMYDRDGSTPQPRPNHDESNCDFHAMLRAPMTADAWAPLLVLAGVFVAFLTLLSEPLAGQGARVRLDCRGPPAH